MKVGAIMQARFDSTRLPGKVLMDLPLGSSVTLLEHIVRRLRLSAHINTIVLATSIEEDDVKIVSEGKKIGADIFAGDKLNVLDRFIKAAELYDLDIIVRLTGDNPIVFIDILDECILSHINGKFDYTYSQGLPIGTNFEIVNKSCLKRIEESNNDNSDREHVTLFIKKHVEDFKINKIGINDVGLLSQARFSIDYPSDYALMNIIFGYLDKCNCEYDLDFFKKLIVDNSWLLEINASNYQKKQYENYLEKVNDAKDLLMKFGFDDLANKLLK